ncbi:OLC1v1015177C1 [Oldenlandia corymbosa var. corymbosa]|uniref:OLC1v1015177C1 n=1 Tax=Oldenlandia corymbosa var. corymbosa TaxID=529605 RepID=A0AAV1E4V2_OLDCO|nr:OLC1v1015177C1 [Oldenlandia corymbosa var. corymbosa]
MADQVLGATVQVVLNSALSFATEKAARIFGFSNDLENLRQSVEMIQAVVADAEERQSRDKAVKLWLRRLGEVTYEAYDVFDELNYEILRRQVKSMNRPPRGTTCSFSSFSHDHHSVAFRLRMASKVQDIIAKLKGISREAAEFQLQERLMHSQLLTALSEPSTNRETNSFVAPDFVGRNDDVSAIVDMLLSSTNHVVVSVLPIIGMGGLGKTTLVKQVFNHERIESHFNKRIWVCVSDQEFDGKKVLRLMLKQLGESVQPEESEEVMVQNIRRKMGGEKYLVVLDDVWSVGSQSWNNFYSTLVGLNRGSNQRSWCLVTSRNETTATTVGTHDTYMLGKLPNDDCWTILLEKVTATASEEIPQELIAIKAQVLQRCAGLPLVAKVLGSLLRSQRKENWLSILEKKPSRGKEDEAMQILKLSFNYLPSSPIKKCFAYLSIFKEDEEIGGDDLIKLWMAEGFLQQDSRSDTTMEEVGGRYIQILLRSSLLEKAKDYKGEEVYKMHDLVHDLTKSVSNNETVASYDGAIVRSCRPRYLALDSLQQIPKEALTDISTSVRTLFLSKGWGMSDEILSKFRNLHVLKFIGRYNLEIVELPNTIGKLKRLRYLSLPRVKSLPESVCKLYNLQTLIISPFGLLQVFPKSMNNLISLKHLDCEGESKVEMPICMGRLTSLQTLKFFNIGKMRGCGIEELRPLEELRGELCIRNLHLVKDKEEASLASLSKRKHLTKLDFQWGYECERNHNCDEAAVLGSLEPHPNLRKLSIMNFMGESLPRWLVNLTMLVKLTLLNCQNCRQLPMLAELPYLEHLCLRGMKIISRMGTSLYCLDDSDGSSISGSLKLFPVLKTLELGDMPNLTEWKEARVGGEGEEAMGVFPVLEKLIIDRCPKLITTPTHFPSLKNLEISFIDNPQIARNILSKVRGGEFGELEIWNMEGLSCLSDDVFGGLVPYDESNKSPPDVKSLQLRRCSNLRRIWSGSSIDYGNSLQELSLVSCPNLVELPETLWQLQSLCHFWMRGCSTIRHVGGGPPPSPNPARACTKTEENRGHHLKSLRSFGILGCHELRSIATEILEGCTSLRELTIQDCPNLDSFPLDFRHTPNLEIIWLANCPKLYENKNNMPSGYDHLPNLTELGLGPFADDASVRLFDWDGLISLSTLKCLEIHGLLHAESCLPDQIQHLTSLRRLVILNFGLLETLPDWLGSLQSLRELSISNCPKLRRLPSKAAMSRLTNLGHIRIKDCPLLKESLRKRGPTSEWSKISHLHMTT